MKDLVIIFEALEKLGYDISGLTFNQGIKLASDLKQAIDDAGVKRVTNEEN
jgi:hypothetical protein